MDLFLVLPIALALAMDAFAVSVGVSAGQRGLSRRQMVRLAVSFGFFQSVMPLLGWLAGLAVLETIRKVDHWVAFALLVAIGTKMIYESFSPSSNDLRRKNDPTKGLKLFVLSVATSLDALAVGFSFSAINLSILAPAFIFGVVAFVMTVVGAKIGLLFGRVAGRRAEFLGGIVLIVIGVKILLDHLN